MGAVITVCSKSPPGGRCKLYIAYADSLAGLLTMTARVVYAGTERTAEPPALVVDGRVIEPADAFMLTPEDIVAGLDGMGLSYDSGTVLARLAEVERKLMEG